MPGRRPDHLVALQPRVEVGPHRRGVADGGDPADHLAGVLADELRLGAAQRRSADRGLHERGVDPVRAGGQDEQRRTFGVEEETVGDRKSTRLNSSHIPLSRMPSSA